MHKDFHSHLPKLVIDTTKQWWFVYGRTFSKRKLVSHVKDFFRKKTETQIFFKSLALDAN